VSPARWWRLALTVAAGAALLGVRPPAARADEPAPHALGRLEQESVDEALAAAGLRVDPHPDGKVIGAIFVVNQEVFSRHDWYFQLLNYFHRTTRDSILERELLLRPGQRYDRELVEESTRNLQALPKLSLPAGRTFYAPELSSVVVILPVVSPRPGTVDLLLVTRDIWSLRFNTSFEFQQNILSFLATSLSENNLFGWRKYAAMNFTMDLGSMAIGPSYYDPNVAGTRLTLYAGASALYTRLTTHYEGNIETASLRYPLFSLASRWGGGIDVYHQDGIVRSFRGNDVRLVPVTVGPEDVEVVRTALFEYRRKIAAVQPSVVRQFGTETIQRFTLGYSFDARVSQVVPGFEGDPAFARLFLQRIAPITEQRSEPFVQYDMFTARYAVYRDLDTFDLRENRTLGPSASVRLAYGAPELGADFRALVLVGAAGYAVAPRGSFGSVSIAGQTRLVDRGFIDQRFAGSFFATTPILRRFFRVIVAGQANAVRADTARTLFALGGDTGLRGYAIGDFQGPADAVGHVELRTVPWAVLSQRVGGLLFYDVGDAGPSLFQLTPFHDFGLGVRWLIPQLNSSVLRLDWAVATQSTAFTRAGLPGRISAGYQQVF
jgi:hypothetical protein